MVPGDGGRAPRPGTLAGGAERDTAKVGNTGLDMVPADEHECSFETVTCASPRHQALETLR